MLPITVRLIGTCWVLMAAAQPAPTADTPPGQAPTADAEQPTTTADADSGAEEEQQVAVVVNGEPILESQVEEALISVIQARLGGRSIPMPLLEQARSQLRPQILDSLIGDMLMDQQVKKQDIQVTDEELKEEFGHIVSSYLVKSNMSRAELSESLQNQRGSTLDEIIAEQVSSDQFKQSVLQSRLLEQRYTDDLKVSDEEIKEKYEADLANVYTQPEMVRASHILIGTEKDSSPEALESARTQAQAVLDEARQPDVDFAELARTHSTGPSKSSGGDLGYFPREGAMVEPFAAAAFALAPGEISDVVQTQFGFHIIKVTAHKDARVVPLDQARETVKLELKNEKLASTKQRLVDELRESATINYTEPQAPAAPESPPTEQPEAATEEPAPAPEPTEPD